jgi:hypothetical protein
MHLTYEEEITYEQMLNIWVKWVQYARTLGYNDWDARKVATKQTGF